MRFTPVCRVYLLGGLIWAALTRSLGDRGEPSFIGFLLVAGLAYLLAVREFLSTPKLPGHVVAIGLVMAGVWHIHFLRMPSGADDDIHRYLWDGRVQRLGYNPYVVIPSNPAVRSLHTAETRGLNNPDLPSPYPAGAQLLFRSVTAVRESIFALKVAFVLCNLAIVFVLLDVLRCSARPAHLVLAYAWNPLLPIEVAWSGHIDMVGALLLLVSFAALGRRWRALAAISFGLAVAVKLLPFVLAPLYWKRIRVRDAALAAGLVGLLYVPFVEHGRIPIGSLGTYVQSFRFNDPVFTKLEEMTRHQLAAGLAVFAGLLTAACLRKTSPQLSPAGFAWPLAASLLCAPVVYPWYLLSLLPFLTSPSTLPIAVWSVSIIPTYVVWHLRTLGLPWLVPPSTMLVEFGSVALAGTILVVRWVTRSTSFRLKINRRP